jgi:hypothetical protein
MIYTVSRGVTTVLTILIRVYIGFNKTGLIIRGRYGTESTSSKKYVSRKLND